MRIFHENLSTNRHVYAEIIDNACIEHQFLMGGTDYPMQGIILFDADQEDELVGYLTYSENEDQTFRIDRLLVVPAYRGKKMGRHLLALFEKQVDPSVNDIWVGTFKNVVGFWQKMGFHMVDEETLLLVKRNSKYTQQSP